MLRDEAIACAGKLPKAGVAVTHLHAQGMTHNFAVAPGTVMRFPQSKEALSDIAAWLSKALYG